MHVVNKQFELQYDEISLTFTAGSVSLWCVCTHAVVVVLVMEEV